MTSDAVMSKLETLEQKIDGLEEEIKEVKGGNQHDSNLKVAESGSFTPYAKEVVKGAKKGGKHDGIDAGDVEVILENHDFERERKAVLRFMRKIEDRIPNMKFRKGNSTRASELQFHPG